MKGKVFIINGHQKWDISPGQLNKTLVDEANKVLSVRGYSRNEKFTPTAIIPIIRASK